MRQDNNSYRNNSDAIWFNPANVIYHFARLKSLTPVEKRNKRFFKKAEEGYFTALALLGVMKYKKNKYWLQIVNDKEGSPDTRTGTFEKRRGERPEFAIQNIEIALYEKHSEEDLIGFLKRTKLPPNKIYPENYTILVIVNKKVVIPPLYELYRELKKLHSCISVVILMGINQETNKFSVCQIYPIVDLKQDFCEEEELNKAIQNEGVIKIVSGDSGYELVSIYFPREEHYPFEAL